MAVRGGIDSLRSPLRGSPLAGSRSVQLAAPVVEPRSGVLIPPAENIKEKSPYLRTGSHLEYGGEGGIDSLRSPLRGSPLAGSRSVQLALPVVEPQSGVLYPPRWVPHAKKKPVLSYELFLKYGGEGGIRTPDTLPYTHFPGVLLQPLGHLTILSFPLLSGTGANVGKYVSPVNQLFAKSARLDKLRTTCSLNVRNPFFLSPLPFHFATRGNLLCWQTNRKQ